MSFSTRAAVTHLPAALPPNWLVLGTVRGLCDIRAYFRNVPAVAFGFALPIGLLLLFGFIYHGNIAGTQIPMSEIVVAGTIASCTMSTGFVNLAIVIAGERKDGTLKRMATVPLPGAAFIAAKGTYVLVIGIAQIFIVLVIGVFAFGLLLPADAMRWCVLVSFVILGLVVNSLLGITVGFLVASPSTAAAVVNFPFILLQFISGVFYTFSALPDGMRVVARIFPLSWLALAFRFCFLPDEAKAVEVGATWNIPACFVVVGLWTVAAFLSSVVLLRSRRFG